MIKRYVTESGSEYIIDFDNKTWERKKGKTATTLRSDSGTFLDFQIMDSGLYLTCPPFVEGAIGRIIHSTPITEEEILSRAS